MVRRGEGYPPPNPLEEICLKVAKILSTTVSFQSNCQIRDTLLCQFDNNYGSHELLKMRCNLLEKYHFLKGNTNNQVLVEKKRKVLEESKNERLGKDNPCRDNDTADETKVQVEELRGRLNLVDDGKLGRAFLFHFQTFLCLHTVNMGPGKDVVGVFINIIISILSYRHNPPPQKTVMICRSIFFHNVLITN